jgi:MoaA/NifB/PqqE/SkfB family radical SAM enzyme
MRDSPYIPDFLRFARDNIIKIIPENSRLFRWLCLVGFRIAARQKHTLRTSMRIDIPVVEHCNLSCRSCTTFGPLAAASFLDIECFTRDMNRLAALTGGRLDAVAFTGGEPLLHPQLTDFFSIARALFKSAQLSFLTNGLLLPQMPGAFWENCATNNVAVSLSRYPIALDITRIKQISNSHGVHFEYVGGSHTPVKSMWKYPLDLEGKQTVSRSFAICNQVNSCIRMKNGRIYPCNTIACIAHFNAFFNTNLAVTADDYIELDKVNAIEEVYRFLIRPKPFCGYCNRKGVVFGIPWAVSKKEITEWV